MKIQEYIDYIGTMLGVDFVEVEIKDGLEKIVKASLEELKEYLTYNKFVTVPFANRIDLTEYKVRSIIQVYREQQADGISGTAGSTDAFLLAIGMVQGVPYDLSRYAQLLQVRKLKNTIATDLDWRWDSPFLYITQNAMASSLITIEYTPIITDVDEIEDEYWVGKLRKLALANAKIVLARTRGKYRLNNALYDNDAAQLLSEGLQEKQDVMKFLEDNHDIILPIGS